MDDQLASDGLAALGNRTRLHVFRALVQAGEDGLNVGELQAHLGIPASTLAHHLQILTRTGLVRQERSGREVISRADYPAMHALIGYLTSECCRGLKPASRESTAVA